MSPITINDKKYFPQQEQLLYMLKTGTFFKTKSNSTIYKKDEDGITDLSGNDKFFPSTMPVIPLKQF